MEKNINFLLHEPLKFESKQAIYTPQFLGFLGKTGQKFLILPILTQMLEVYIFNNFLTWILKI